ncbi:MAG: hypothetical protein Q9220_001966 [cf. Caloplaca sp. 1 TL-2023]
MCFFKIDTKQAPIQPPGAAPTLMTVGEHYKAAIAGQMEGPNGAPEGHNATSKSIAQSLNVNETLEPSRLVGRDAKASYDKRRVSVPLVSLQSENPARRVSTIDGG